MPSACQDINGHLPTRKSGRVGTLPGQTWQNLHSDIRRHPEKFYGAKTLSDLFNLVGLKRGMKEDPEAITAALRRLHKTGDHRLVPGDRFEISPGVVICHSLEYARENIWRSHIWRRLPSLNSGKILTLPGRQWGSFNNYINSHPEKFYGAKGLADLFYLAGLRTVKGDNQEAIAAALKRLDETGEHGLTLKEELIPERRARPPAPGGIQIQPG
jgi:hypothetical protein